MLELSATKGRRKKNMGESLLWIIDCCVCVLYALARLCFISSIVKGSNSSGNPQVLRVAKKRLPFFPEKKGEPVALRIRWE